MDKEFIKSKLLELEEYCDLVYLNKYIDFCILNHDPDLIKGANHHILSATLFPEYKNFKEHTWNLSRLTNYNHYIAHAILFKSINNVTFGFAWYAMNNKDFVSNKDKPVELIGPDLYDELILKRNKLCSEINIGKVSAKDLRTGKKLKVTKEEFDSNPNLVGHTLNMTSAKNKLTGEKVYVSTEEFNSDDNLVGLLTGINQIHMLGKMIAKDKDGNNSLISNTDPRYLSGELTSINKGRKFGEEFGRKISEHRKLSGDCVGDKNPKANLIVIFDDKDEAQYFSYGNYNQMCKDNNLSEQLFARTYNNNTKMYDYVDDEFIEKSRKWVITKLFSSDLYIKYKGWYARKMERIKI